METRTIQGSLFAEDYLRRTLRSIANDPLMALTELVANGWDAGARQVDIRLPEHEFETLTVEDDGIGMTRAQFIERWMTLGYDRKKHQGRFVEFPPGRQGRRRAFGRNGLGRHALLCFADEYSVVTKRDGKGWRFTVRTMSGEEPFGLVREEPLDVRGHGTRLEVSVERNLVSPEKVIDVLSARFLHDPTFEVCVNGNTIDLTELPGFLESHDLDVDGIRLNMSCIDSSLAARRMAYHGIAFWVGGRLVGEPSWQIGKETILDGRTAHAKRFTIVVRCDDEEIFDHIHSDWSDFGDTALVRAIQQKVAEFANDFLRRSLATQIEETKESVLRDHRDELEQLDTLGQVEVAEFLEQVTHSMPRVSADTLEVATTAFINLAQSHSGKSLLAKIAQLGSEDLEALNTILDEWTVQDALLVLREIDRRLAVIQALDRIIHTSVRHEVDELHTIHPLVTQARWLFGPQYESEEYTFNKTVHKALEELFCRRIDKANFINYKNRPDLICLGDSTLSATAAEKFDDQGDLVQLDNILIIEVKRADKLLIRKEMDQASGYIEDLAASGVIDGSPRIHAFVVGERLDNRMKKVAVRKIGDPEFGKVTACTFDQLIRTADRRFIRLRSHIESHYNDIPPLNLIKRILGESFQTTLPLSNQ